MNPVHIYVLTALAGFAVGICGVFVLFGLGWSLLAGAASLLLIAGFVRKGLTGD